MQCKKSFVEDLHFSSKENLWNDPDSLFEQDHLVGVFPLHKIPSIEKKKSLENYGIPAGILHFTHGKSGLLRGGAIDKTQYKKKPTELIDDHVFDSLFHLVSDSPPRKNKTRKIHIKKYSINI
jgi:hypothetical protein